jgi:hypothetical protein
MHRVQLYPTSRQEAHLRFMLDVTRQTYNALQRELEVRRWRSGGARSRRAEVHYRGRRPRLRRRKRRKGAHDDRENVLPGG